MVPGRITCVVSALATALYLASGVVYLLRDLVAKLFARRLTVPLVVLWAITLVVSGLSVPVCDRKRHKQLADSEKKPVFVGVPSELDSGTPPPTEAAWDISKKASEKTLVEPHHSASSDATLSITLSQNNGKPAAGRTSDTPTTVAAKNVRRSKSTPIFAPPRGSQSRKSIDHERDFLRSVSQVLLPSVLKEGESPILVLKQQMQPEARSGGSSEQNSVDLPYIDEFGEDPIHFPDFDQPEISTEQAEKYVGALDIAEPSGPLWTLEHLSVSGGQVNHISHGSWNPHAFQEHQGRPALSGPFLAVGSRAARHSVKLRNNSSATLALDDADATFLLPSHASNIDSLSDVVSSRPLLHRTVSAPSLLTFRNTSSAFDAAPPPTNHQLLQKTVDLTRVHTPTSPPEEVAYESPIRRFIKESPTRLSSVFKKKSMDIATPAHKHSGLVISQFSMASSKSSPRKSIKSLFSGHPAGPLHRSQASVPNFNLPATSAKFSEPIDFWELETPPSSGGPLRISSVPSDVIGAYDREKWRTLQMRDEESRPVVTTVDIQHSFSATFEQ